MNVVVGDIVKRIDMLIDQQGTKRAYLYESLKMSNSTFTDWSNGVMPSVEKVARVAGYFKVSLDWLVTGNDPQGLTSDQREALRLYDQLEQDDKEEMQSIMALKLERYAQKGVSRLGMAG
jgi:transcriptional regulator with XRE-family HTH domain